MLSCSMTRAIFCDLKNKCDSMFAKNSTLLKKKKKTQITKKPRFVLKSNKIVSIGAHVTMHAQIALNNI